MVYRWGASYGDACDSCIGGVYGDLMIDILGMLFGTRWRNARIGRGVGCDY